MFAAVMRKAGVPKQLECHGFVCDSPEEAILVAANLYQALLETMKRNKRPNSSSQVRKLVSELHQGVTGKQSRVPTLWCLGRLSGLGSKLPPCCWIAPPHEWAKGPRATLSGRA